MPYVIWKLPMDLNEVGDELSRQTMTTSMVEGKIKTQELRGSPVSRWGHTHIPHSQPTPDNLHPHEWPVYQGSRATENDGSGAPSARAEQPLQEFFH